ncbi:programmed cell death protein 2-like isoform X1 [Dermochelys coriacea]|uniref:programmed cell death protein 2-like isoform X1 n=1 Tax=Dermochelys coriacea TaxID=27794 RepID=UPI0018E700F9|nr:programmed cell death protein 2-like isoform X1 [Dermochelys coriacea]
MAASACRAPEPRVLLGLRDAALPDPGRDNLQPPSWATSKLGGSPNCAPSVTMTYPSCGICGAILMHIVQIYCPLEGSLFQRVINVFACAVKGCWGKSESWKVLRSQYLQMQGKETQDCKLKQKQENNFATKDWCDGADDWGICDETEYPVQTTSHLLGLNTVSSSSLSTATECASQFQGLSLSETTDISDSLHRPVPCGDGIVMPTLCPRFQSYYISVVDEEDYIGYVDTDHAHKLLKEYQQREGIDLEQLMSESFVGEGDNEKYEKSEGKNRDHVFHKFMKRISSCREQILRYSWGGQPLFITCPSSSINKMVPVCNSCGSNRVFEFQLMPALVSMLKSVDADLSVEFGTVIVYTCERSCWPANHQNPLEEFIFIQEDPDQQLFK